MHKRCFFWQLIGCSMTCFLGTVLHFLYEWAEYAVWLAPISAVNESTWEHMKILFVPMFLFAFLQYRFWQERPQNFWCVKAVGIVGGSFTIPTLFYTYNGAIGPSPALYNIAVFFTAAAIAYGTEWHIFRRGNGKCRLPTVSFALLCILALLFVLCTFRPPTIPLFLDPRGWYGIR